MTYEEAEKAIEALEIEGLEISKIDAGFYVQDESLGFLMAVRNDSVNQIETTEKIDGAFGDKEQEDALVDILVELAHTPIEERESKPKRYYVHLLFGENGYLNIKVQSGYVMASTKNEYSDYQTSFTEEEINKLADDNPHSLMIHFDPNNPVFEEVSDKKY